MYCCTPKALYDRVCVCVCVCVCGVGWCGGGGGGGGVSPQPPPPVCSINLDYATAATGQVERSER